MSFGVKGLREENRLIVLDIGVTKKIFGPRREK
jgi:hypothetical protein